MTEKIDEPISRREECSRDGRRSRGSDHRTCCFGLFSSENAKDHLAGNDGE